MGLHVPFHIAQVAHSSRISAFFEGEVVPEVVCDRTPTRRHLRGALDTLGGHFYVKEEKEEKKKWRENFPIYFSTNQNLPTVLQDDPTSLLHCFKIS